MTTNLLMERVVTQNAAGLGTVSRGMARLRATELAVMNGRSALDISKSDWEQAKRELTGQADLDA